MDIAVIGEQQQYYYSAKAIQNLSKMQIQDAFAWLLDN